MSRPRARCHHPAQISSHEDLSRRLGVAVVIITHNLGIVARYPDRVNV